VAQQIPTALKQQQPTTADDQTHQHFPLNTQMPDQVFKSKKQKTSAQVVSTLTTTPTTPVKKPSVTLLTDTYNSIASPSSNIHGESDYQNMPRGDPAKWNCDEMVQFVNVVTKDDAEVAKEFRNHRIDGSALNSIGVADLSSIMQIKLGPAVNIMETFKHTKSHFASVSANGK
jgi:hypothetical protein